jgi:hypothetical protein
MVDRAGSDAAKSPSTCCLGRGRTRSKFVAGPEGIELVDKASLDASAAYKIVKAARRQIDTGFITAKQLYDKRQNLLRLTLGSQNLNTRTLALLQDRFCRLHCADGIGEDDAREFSVFDHRSGRAGSRICEAMLGPQRDWQKLAKCGPPIAP